MWSKSLNIWLNLLEIVNIKQNKEVESRMNRGRDHTFINKSEILKEEHRRQFVTSMNL